MNQNLPTPNFCESNLNHCSRSGPVVQWNVWALAWMCGATWLLGALGAPPAKGQEEKAASIQVMSYNIRYGTARDGDNHWSKRKDDFIALIKKYDPDLLGTQETLAFQGEFIRQNLPHLASFGVGRDDGREGGEMALLFYRSDRFEKLDGGNFWLSETPDEIASQSWDSALPRIASWVHLKDLRSSDQRQFLFLNTHFDHVGREARQKSSQLLKKFISDYLATCDTELSVVITGDFNEPEGSPSYQALVGQPVTDTLKLLDTYRVVHPQRGPDEGTFSGFDARRTGGGRIDWILVSDHWRIRDASIDRTSKENRTPSDHFPVLAEIN